MLINCDMGEGLQPNPDPEVIPHIDLANFACGGHAGDADTLQSGLSLAKQHQVKVGAHPSYPDRENFGRRALSLTEFELKNCLNQQLALIEQQAKMLGLQIHHVKPHGALYLDMMRSKSLFTTLLDIHQTWQTNIGHAVAFVIQANICDANYQQLAQEKGVILLRELFADRAYLPNGHLAPRSQPNSLYQNAADILQQAQRFIEEKKGETLCFHSDNPASVIALKQLENVAKLTHAQ